MMPVGACASDSITIDHSREISGDPVKEGASLAGNYLAGRHAQAMRDMPGATLYLGKALALSPDTPDLLRRAFIMLASQGRIGEAVPIARKVLRTNPQAPIAGLAVVVEDLHDGRYKDAKAKIAALPNGGLNTYMAPMLAAWTSAALGESLQKATDHLTPLNKEGSKPLYYLHKALIEDFKGEQATARKTFQDEMREQGGASLRVVQLLGNLYERQGDTAGAEALYKEFGQVNPRSPVVRDALKRLKTGAAPKPVISHAAQGAAEGFFGIATTLSQQNAQETALLFARLGLYLRPDFPVLQILLGNVLQSSDQLAIANEVYQSIDPKSPFSWPARLRVAENLDELDDTEQAVKTLKSMAREEPTLSDPLTRLGDILRSRERFNEAVTAYDGAIERIGALEHHHWSLLYARGIVLERSRQWERAEADFLKALDFEPEQPFVLNYLGYSWIDQGKHLNRATDMIRRAVDLRPNDGYIVDSLGWAHFRLGQFDVAIKEMERAVELRPEDPVLNDHLGDALWRVGREIEARYQWQRVLTLEPDDEVRAAAEDKITKGLPALPVRND